jgi:Family of unknown function (DUF5706)
MAVSPINPTDTYEKILISNLQRAIDFLKFAEAKNAALLALASAWVVAIINLECSGKAIPDPLATSVSVTLLLSLSAGLLAMLSFLPKLHLPGFMGGKRAGPHPANLLYFGDVGSLTIKALEQNLQARYFPDGKGFKPEYIHDLIVQISVNSEITLRKMRLFRSGMMLILLAGTMLFIPVAEMAFKAAKTLW